MTTNANTEKSFFNFTATATCFINDITVIKPKKAEAFVSMKVAILEGETTEPEKVYADLIVRGKQAKDVLREHKAAFPKFGKTDKPTWFASIKFGSIEAKPYLSKNGEARATLSGRLIKFTYLKIGENVINLNDEEKAA